MLFSLTSRHLIAEEYIVEAVKRVRELRWIERVDGGYKLCGGGWERVPT